MTDLINVLGQPQGTQSFDQIRISIASPERIRAWSLRRDQEAGDHQLPHLQAGARRPVLRPHLRADQGLRVPVRQVQAHEVSRHHLREVRRRGDALQGAPRAHGPHRAGLAGRAHLVPEVAAEPHRPAARHDAARPREDPLLRELRGDRAGPDAAQAARAAERGPVPQRAQDEYGDDAFRAGIGAEAIRAMLQVIDLDEERDRGCATSCARPPPRPSARSWSSA